MSQREREREVTMTTMRGGGWATNSRVEMVVGLMSFR